MRLIQPILKSLGVLAVVLSFATLHGQDFQIQLNPNTHNIGDGEASVIGSDSIVNAHWSNLQSVDSTKAQGLKEGINYTVSVTFANGNVQEQTFAIPAVSSEEKMNSFFVPIVDAFGVVLFYDPFAALNLYDPFLYDNEGKLIKHPNGNPVKSEIWLVVVLLIGSAVYFTFYFRFINVRAFGHAWKITFGQFTKKTDEGEVTPFQALSAALSGTLGLGNISLVAVAIAVGGPGATFWIIVAGLFGMTTKFVECTLGVKYRKISSTGEVSGGPMYYLSAGLAKKGWQRSGNYVDIADDRICKCRVNGFVSCNQWEQQYCTWRDQQRRQQHRRFRGNA
jgi:AGCS family alanine or glycine:cation symporter